MAIECSSADMNEFNFPFDSEVIDFVMLEDSYDQHYLESIVHLFCSRHVVDTQRYKSSLCPQRVYSEVGDAEQVHRQWNICRWS